MLRDLLARRSPATRAARVRGAVAGLAGGAVCGLIGATLTVEAIVPAAVGGAIATVVRRTRRDLGAVARDAAWAAAAVGFMTLTGIAGLSWVVGPFDRCAPLTPIAHAAMILGLVLTTAGVLLGPAWATLVAAADVLEGRLYAHARSLPQDA